MAHLKLDRVAGTTTSVGVGALTLSATAVEGFDRFQDVASNGDTAFVMIVDQATGIREGALVTYNTGAITRTTTLSSSTGSRIDFPAGTKDVFIYDPAAKSVSQDPNGNASVDGEIIQLGAPRLPVCNGILGVANTSSSATGSANKTALDAAIAIAVASGISTIEIRANVDDPTKGVGWAGTVDFNGLNVYSPDNAIVFGTMTNTGRIEGVRLNGVSMSEAIQAPPPPSSNGSKIILQATSTSWYVFSQNPDRADRFVGIHLVSGSGEAGKTPWDHRRETEVLSLTDVYAYQSPRDPAFATTNGSAWVDWDFTADYIGSPAGVDNGASPKFLTGIRSNAQGDYVDVVLAPNRRGYGSILLHCNSSGSPKVEVVVDRGQGLSTRTLETLGADTAVNGAFAADTDWTKGSGWSITGGQAVRATLGATGALTQSQTLTLGKSYDVTYTLTVSAGSIVSRLSGGSNVSGPARTVSGTYTDRLVAVSGNNLAGFSAGSTFNGTIDNFSIREVTPTTVKAAPEMTIDTYIVGAPGLQSFEIFVGAKAKTVRLTQADSGPTSYLMLAGINAHRPGQADPLIPYTSWAWYVDQNNPYVVNAGAADYALLLTDIGDFAGSYHGLEEAIDPAVWYLDGAATTFTSSVPKACKVAEIVQHTMIADLVECRCRHRYHLDGGSELTLSLLSDGTVGSPNSYVGMTLAANGFTEIAFPKLLDVTAANTYPVAVADLMIHVNPTTRQRIYSWHSLQKGWNNQRGGVHVLTAVSATGYNKRRTGLMVDGENTLPAEITAIIAHQYRG